MKALGTSALVFVLMMFARAGCRGALHRATYEPTPTRAIAQVPVQPAKETATPPRRLLHYETYISGSGRECWLNRANEGVCK